MASAVERIQKAFFPVLDRVLAGGTPERITQVKRFLETDQWENSSELSPSNRSGRKFKAYSDRGIKKGGYSILEDEHRVSSTLTLEFHEYQGQAKVSLYLPMTEIQHNFWVSTEHPVLKLKPFGAQVRGICVLLGCCRSAGDPLGTSSSFCVTIR